MKRLAILGSTGSIGVNTLEIVGRFKEEFEVLALSGGSNVPLLREQISAFKPRLVSVRDEEHTRALKSDGVEVVYGEEGLIQAATFPGVDLVVSAVVGSVGIRPLLAAIEAGRDIALANKESMVMAGEVIMKKAHDKGVAILPIDSEHSAIFQALGSRMRGEGVKRIILTASGGPLYATPAEAFKKVTPKEAVAHPVWRMGPKISVDSATMMNKGLEVIEAHWFFRIPPERIEVLIHRQGIVHSLVEYVDSSIIAQLSIPDMRIPIAYALSYPRRLAMELPVLNLVELNHLRTMPTVLNAANEAAVGAFLQGRIGFDQIPHVVASTMDTHQTTPLRAAEAALEADQWAKAKALEFIQGVIG
jgi:1-deoxy-D-xylulose-5-phosphate reductoisomerase